MLDPTVEVFIVLGFQVPVIPSKDCIGKFVGVVFIQNGPIAENAGVKGFVMETLIEVTLAHCPAEGEKVKLKLPVFVVEIVEGFQVPAIPFVELGGKAGAVPFKQIGFIGVNEGVML